MVRSIWVLMICLGLDLSSSRQQFYDEKPCNSDRNFPGTRYACDSSRKSCETFIVYRANGRFPTLSSVANLFQQDPSTLLSINNVSTPGQVLEPDREVVLPVTCSCAGRFFQSNLDHTVAENGTLSELACGIFEGLVKYVTLAEKNHVMKDPVRVGSVISVPLKCACPESDSDPGLKFLVTYPLVEGDNTRRLSEKFNVPVEEIWHANQLESPLPTVNPNTTILVPLKGEPFINFSILDSDPPTQFLPTKPVEKLATHPKTKKLYTVGAVLGLLLILALLIACVVHIRTSRQIQKEWFLSSKGLLNSGSAARSSTNSCLSPDLLIGIKYSLYSYTTEEIKLATNNFREDSRICASRSVYKGMIDNDEVMIKEMKFEDTKQVIDVHLKMNHVNIVKLLGICYGQHHLPYSYLVFEYPSKGSLRDCLEMSSASFHWQRRTQVAFDIAIALHYLHNSVIPAYTHSSVSCKDIYLTSTWRAKLTVFGNGTESGALPENRISTAESRVSDGNLCTDVLAFGVVMLELISGKQAMDGKMLKESTSFLGGGGTGNEGGCFDQLRNWVDPNLKDEYSLAEALCLAVLARSCVEEDPLHRPSMDDALKIIARML